LRGKKRLSNDVWGRGGVKIGGLRFLVWKGKATSISAGGFQRSTMQKTTKEVITRKGGGVKNRGDRGNGGEFFRKKSPLNWRR